MFQDFKTEYTYYRRRGTKFFFRSKEENKKYVLYCGKELSEKLKDDLVVGKTYVLETILNKHL